MRDVSSTRLAKWPFILGDLLLLGVAYFISTRASGTWALALLALTVALGALLSISPFILEYRVAARVAEADALATATAQLRHLRSLAEQISGATARWQNVQEGADKTAAAARGIAERMEAEVRSFTEFMQKANDSEKANLRLEAEKLHRMEGEWLQVTVRILDHVFALHQGAVRSGQPNLITQLTNFQKACLDGVRRVGVAPFIPGPAEPFDPQRHQLMEEQATPSPGAKVGETIATGYTYQGRIIRPALVRLGQEAAVVAAPVVPAAALDEPKPEPSPA